MKKTGLLIVVALFIFTLSGCSKQVLSNDYFDNPNQESISTALDLFDKYLVIIEDDFESKYPRFGMENYILYDSNYINIGYRSGDELYRHQLVNTTLGDERDYMLYSPLYILKDYLFTKAINQNCPDTKEGELCIQYQEEDPSLIKYSFQYYINEDHLFIDYVTAANGDEVLQYQFNFHMNDSFNLVMEFSFTQTNENMTKDIYSSYTKCIKNEYEESYISDNSKFEDKENTVYKYIYFDHSTKDYILQKNISNLTEVYMYIGDENALYNINYIDINGALETEYTEYYRNTRLVTYSSKSFRMNLSQVIGWDHVLPNEETPWDYSLYFGDNLLSTENDTISFEQDTAEYIYYYYEAGYTSLTEEIVTLHQIGLESGYTISYFEDKIDSGLEIYNSFLDSHSINYDIVKD